MTLHHRFDALPDPQRELTLLAIVGTLVLAIAQPWSFPLSLGAAAIGGVLIGSRIRHVEQDSRS